MQFFNQTASHTHKLPTGVTRSVCTATFTCLSVIISTVSLAQSTQDTAVELEEIIVEAEGEPEAQKPLGIGISGETLRTAPGSAGDPMRTLQTLPGLTFSNDEEALPAVRGSRPDDNYFLVDFAPVGYLFHFGQSISVLNADLVESFDIYQSAYGPEYAGVTGGVFDIKLREPKKDRLRSVFDISIFHAGALIEGPVAENQSFYLAGRISYLDLFLDDQIPEEDGITIKEFPKYSDYQGKYVWETDADNKLTFQFNGASDTGRIDLSEEAEEVETDPDLAGSFFTETAFHGQAVVWDSTHSDRLSSKSLLSHGYSSEVGEFAGAGDIEIDANEILLKSQADYVINDKHTAIVGGQLSRANVDLDLSLKIPPCGELDVECFITGSEELEKQEKFDFTAYRLYAKDNWYITDRLTLYPGLAFRGEDYRDEWFLEPRFALEYSLNETTLLTAGAGHYRQAPSYLESDTVFGNPEIKYSSAVHGQIGIQRDFANGWDVKSELYYKSLDDLVTSDSEKNYTNDGSGYAYGLDTLIRKNVTDKLSGWAAVSLSKARRKDKRTGEEIVFDHDQPVNVSLVGKYEFNPKWALGAKLWAHSGSPYTPVIGATEDPNIPGFYRPQYAKINSGRFPTYKRLDLRVDRTFKRKKGNSTTAYFELLNVLGTKNAAGYDYNADYTERTQYSQLEGIFSIGVKATF